MNLSIAKPDGYAIALANNAGFMLFGSDQIRIAFRMTQPGTPLYAVFTTNGQSPSYQQLPLHHGMLHYVKDMLRDYEELEDAITELAAR